MPVRKFRSVEEIPEPWQEPGTPKLRRTIASVWDFAAKTCPLRFPPGVYRHRSIEDAKRQRALWEETNFQAFWDRRGGLPKT